MQRKWQLNLNEMKINTFTLSLLSDWMEQEEKYIRITDLFRTTQSSEGVGPVQQQTTQFPSIPSTSAAQTPQPTTVKTLKTTETLKTTVAAKKVEHV